MATLKEEIIKLAIAVSVVCIVFSFTQPIFDCRIACSHAHGFYQHVLGVTANVMSLSGIAIAIGAMVCRHYYGGKCPQKVGGVGREGGTVE